MMIAKEGQERRKTTTSPRFQSCQICEGPRRYACNLLLLPMISLFLVLRLINVPCFALVSYFGLVSILIGFSSFEKF